MKFYKVNTVLVRHGDDTSSVGFYRYIPMAKRMHKDSNAWEMDNDYVGILTGHILWYDEMTKEEADAMIADLDSVESSESVYVPELRQYRRRSDL